MHFNKKFNTYDLSGEYGIGYTSKGEKFYFDLEDYDKIKDYCWCISSTTKTVVARVCGSNKNVAMHRLVMGFPEGKQIDHIHHNKFDNRKSELRVCSNKENNHNKAEQSNNSSGHRGISWAKRDKAWHAYIEVDGKRINKYFRIDEIDEAIKWREEKEKELFGEFAYDE